MKKKTNMAYVLLVPWVIGFLVFKLLPILLSFYYSLTKFSILTSPEFIGLENYKQIFTNDKVFTISFMSTLKYVMISTPLILFFALFVAFILNFKLKGVNFFRTAYYIPSILGGNVAVSILWVQLFGLNGPINMFLNAIGFESAYWLTDERYAIFTLIVLRCWQFGSTMLIFLSALQNVPASLYEAAEIDGAGKVRTFLSVTIPIITPVVLFNMVNVLVKSFQEFNSAYLITKGGPNYSTYFLNVYIYDMAFAKNNYGYASALTWILLILISTLTIIIFKSSKKWVHYND